MAQPEIRELIKSGNPVRDPTRLLPEAQDVDRLFAEIMNRVGIPQPTLGVDTSVEPLPKAPAQQKAIRTAGPSEPPSHRHRMAPALAAAAAVLIAIMVVTPLWRDADPGPANRTVLTPLEVGEAMNQAALTGDFLALRLLYADDATFTDLVGLRESGFESQPFLTATGAPIADWDGDLAVTWFDEILLDMASDYVAAATPPYACEQTNRSTIVCQGEFDGHAFLPENPGVRVTNTYTILDGLIRAQSLNASPLQFREFAGTKSDGPQVEEYRDWAKEWATANQPELSGNFFPSFMISGLSPENLESHRMVIAEWVSQR